MPHAALCVSRQLCVILKFPSLCRFNAARSLVCVETTLSEYKDGVLVEFQCRTQHCVCRDRECGKSPSSIPAVSMPHAALCVSRLERRKIMNISVEVSMPHAALCVSRPRARTKLVRRYVVSMPHAALCVSRLLQSDAT